MSAVQQDERTDVVVVTGGASGIGRATTLLFLADGYRAVVADLNEKSLSRIEAEATELGFADRLATAVTDVRSEAAVQAAVQTAVDRFGRLTCMVNNAGLGGAFGRITEIEAEDFDFTFEVLVRGVFFGMKYAARVMQAQGTGGAIVNTASAAAVNAGFGLTTYSAAKSAVVSLTKSVAVELAPSRIRVNAVCPGVIDTPLLRSGRTSAFDDSPPKPQPWPDWGQPEDIANAIAFLAGPDSSFLTGEALLVDGGIIAAGPGEDLKETLGNDPSAGGLVGVNRGTTGQRSEIRRREA